MQGLFWLLFDSCHCRSTIQLAHTDTHVHSIIHSSTALDACLSVCVLLFSTRHTGNLVVILCCSAQKYVPKVKNQSQIIVTGILLSFLPAVRHIISIHCKVVYISSPMRANALFPVRRFACFHELEQKYK